MIKSMTGYGTATYSNDSKEVSVEVKSLNSKFLDASLRVTKSFSDKEIEIRSIVSEILVRGKVNVTVEIQSQGAEQISVAYNDQLFKLYYHKLAELAKMVNSDDNEIFKLALQSPDVITGNNAIESSEEDWELVRKAITEALNKCDQHRIDEGKVLADKLAGYIKSISEGLDRVSELDPDRVKNIRSRIEENIVQFVEEEKIDKNRLEQELIYYIEKLDLSEEKVRLANHLNYFTEILNLPESNGKKLGFIAQEIGREINTIGSKANDSTIQKIVVEMKDELEKIKEQVLNVL